VGEKQLNISFIFSAIPIPLRTEKVFLCLWPNQDSPEGRVLYRMLLDKSAEQWYRENATILTRYKRSELIKIIYSSPARQSNPRTIVIIKR